MLHINDICYKIKNGAIPMPNEVRNLQDAKLKEVLDTLLLLLFDNSGFRERSNREDVLDFTNLYVEDDDYVVFLVNLSTTGALITVNTNQMKYFPTQQGKILIQPKKIANLEVPDTFLDVKFVRQADYRDEYSFFGLQFVALDDEKIGFIDSLLSSINKLSE